MSGSAFGREQAINNVDTYAPTYIEMMQIYYLCGHRNTEVEHNSHNFKMKSYGWYHTEM